MFMQHKTFTLSLSIYIYIYIYDGCPLGFERDYLLCLMSFPPPLLPLPYSLLKFYMFGGDSPGQPSCDRFYHRIGTTVQFCLQ